MKELIKKNLLPFVCLIVLLVLLIIGSIWDLQISQKLVALNEGNYYTHNIFGIIFETIGEMPIYLITAFASALIFHNFKRRKKSWFNLAVQIFAVLVSVALLFYMNYKLFKYLAIHLDFTEFIGETSDTIAYFLLGACMTFLLFYLTQRLPSSFLNKMLIWALIVWGTAFISQVLTHLLKAVAARPRYRAMFMMDDFTIYRRWFQFQWGIPEIEEDLVALYNASSDWFKSFPSGHTSAGTMVITLTLIPSLFTKTNTFTKKFITVFVVIAYVLAVMFSRILVGAHFLTDVTFGALITLGSTCLSVFIVKKVMKKITVTDLIERTKPCLIEEEIKN